ncbi:hypothetical protein Tco_0656727 [Tanacetum coccineum]|uniref:Uncharacterized protein n=1 Tax=Tanacetum coccineum TaxID=301880 RepID=A0ABQ4XAA2_9ASTR
MDGVTVSAGIEGLAEYKASASNLRRIQVKTSSRSLRLLEAYSHLEGYQAEEQADLSFSKCGLGGISQIKHYGRTICVELKQNKARVVKVCKLLVEINKSGGDVPKNGRA